MYKTILFDFYGVINRHDPYRLWLDAHDLKREGQFKEVADKVDVGLISYDEFLTALSKLSEQPVDSIRKAFEDGVDLDQEVIKTLRQLRPTYKLALLSNAPADFLRPTLGKYDLKEVFSKVFISSEMGLRKPDPAFFRLALAKLGTNAAETLFVDDLPQFVSAAKGAGIDGIVFKNASLLKRELAEKGVNLSDPESDL